VDPAANVETDDAQNREILSGQAAALCFDGDMLTPASVPSKGTCSGVDRFDEVLSVSGYEQGAARVVLTQRRRPQGVPGLSIEFYGRHSDNRWVEALRLDSFPGEVHYHWFHTDGTFGVVDIDEGDGTPTSTLSTFLAEHGRKLLSDSGFFPAEFGSHLDPALAHVREALARMSDQGPSGS
jgi:hypothetical protein